MVIDEESTEKNGDEGDDREGDPRPWSAPSKMPPFPIATDHAFAEFFTATLAQETRYVFARYRGIAPDMKTAEQIVSDAYHELYKKKETVEKDPIVKLEDEITNVVRKLDRRRMVSLDGPGFSGDVIPAETDVHSVASEVAGIELATLFSQEAVDALDKAERLLYNLVAKGMTLKEIAKRSGISYERTKSDWKKVYFRLCDIMGKLSSRMGDEKREPLRTRKDALKAIDDLPILLRQVVGLFHVDKLPGAQVALRLKLASEDEVRMHLGRAYEILEKLYGEIMPAALDDALNHIHGNSKKRPDSSA
jgi:DNA-directed RNA polymerase specialized sigma24 family protein